MCILWTSTKARTLVDRCRVSSGPIRDYKPLESQTPFQIDAESLIVFTRPIAYLSETQANTDQVVRAHDRAQSCLHGPFKRGIVDLELSSLVDIFLHREISLKIRWQHKISRECTDDWKESRLYANERVDDPSSILEFTRNRSG